MLVQKGPVSCQSVDYSLHLHFNNSLVPTRGGFAIEPFILLRIFIFIIFIVI